MSEEVDTAAEVINWKEKKKQLKEWKKQKEEKKQKKAASKAEAMAAVELDVNQETQSRGRPWTLSIALPASILLNAQSPELRTYLAGQIARAAVVFNVDEIVVFDEYALAVGEDGDPGTDEKKKCLYHLAKILEYLECPQYLRKFLFPLQKDLQFAGLLNPLDCFHHLKSTDLDIPFREGIVSNKPTKDGTGENSTKGSYIYVGLESEVQIDRIIKPGVRVTVEFDPSPLTEDAPTIRTTSGILSQGSSPEKKRKRNKKVKGKAVAPSTPRTKMGFYWGYSVRIAGNLSSVFSDAPYKGGYDLIIGTSERGDLVDDVIGTLPTDYKHSLVVFGGLKGIEGALDSDEKLSQIDDPRDLFGFYLNTCPNQGSHTIRTEEAILITLSSLRPRLLAARTAAK